MKDVFPLINNFYYNDKYFKQNILLNYVEIIPIFFIFLSSVIYQTFIFLLFHPAVNNISSSIKEIA